MKTTNIHKMKNCNYSQHSYSKSNATILFQLHV